MTDRLLLGPDSVPSLPRHIKLRWDKRREQWVIQAPEKVMFPDEIAVAILNRCDGAATLGEIVAALAAEYDEKPEDIAADVTEMLQDLADKGYVTA
ncbi:MAG: pyrroloquinoline quinone biosynthesis peptide chaperone PqqD [Minwuiales bacterium]|nr:pyrroloquinoline quinone biosynthesis peptide chaperone PqqD [Minwuiales bacterium]